MRQTWTNHLPTGAGFLASTNMCWHIDWWNIIPAACAANGTGMEGTHLPPSFLQRATRCVWGRLGPDSRARTRLQPVPACHGSPARDRGQVLIMLRRIGRCMRCMLSASSEIHGQDLGKERERTCHEIMKSRRGFNLKVFILVCVCHVLPFTIGKSTIWGLVSSRTEYLPTCHMPLKLPHMWVNIP